ncbi:MAG: hypothetical protein Q7R51_00855 [bacterium]|nr:hypothetical protein [bacterium]
MKSKNELIRVYKKILKGNFVGWVIFSHGTCVVVPHIDKAIRDDAISILQKYGKVIPGTPLGDFNITSLKDSLGWVVTGGSPDILNFIAIDETKEKSDDVKIGLLARKRKELDAKELKVIHVEQITPLPINS